MKNLYIPRLRPVGFATVPDDLRDSWRYVEAPPDLYTRPDLPRSRHLYGVVEVPRPLTADEESRFGWQPAEEKPS
jgi:hypothetical protein